MKRKLVSVNEFFYCWLFNCILSLFISFNAVAGIRPVILSSSDGIISIQIKDGGQVVFSSLKNGAGADQNPLPRRTVPLAQQYGRTPAAVVERVLSEDMLKLAPVLTTAYSEIDLQFAGLPPTKEELLEIMGESSTYPDYQKCTAKTLLTRMDAENH